MIESAAQRGPTAGRDELVLDIVQTLADETGCSPTELSPPLADVVDPDALQQLLESAGTDVRVTFTYLNRQVTVDSDGSHTVDRLETER